MCARLLLSVAITHDRATRLCPMSSSSATRNCGPCTKTSDNKHFDCPARMADGRLFTDYRPRCDVNFSVVSRGGGNDKTQAPADSYAYRQYLIANTDSLLQAERRRAYSGASCSPCAAFDKPGTMLPERVIDVCDTRTCRRVPGNDPVNGLGLGREYGFEKSVVRTPSSAASRNCCTTAYDVQNYYPAVFDDNTGDPMSQRLSVPGGASTASLEGGDPGVM